MIAILIKKTKYVERNVRPIYFLRRKIYASLEMEELVIVNGFQTTTIIIIIINKIHHHHHQQQHQMDFVDFLV